MPDEPFMLVSLEGAKAKKLANVMSNETCTKLLNYLAKHSGHTESEIAKASKLPLSTVHYNLKQLVEAKLVKADEFHYSSKGREVLHYRLANKYIIIAPQEEQPGFFDALKRILPAFFIMLGFGLVLSVLGAFQGSFGAQQSFSAMEMQVASDTSVPEMIDISSRNTAVPEPTAAPMAASAPKAEAGGAAADAFFAEDTEETAVLLVENVSNETRPAPSLPQPAPVIIIEQTEGFALLSWQLIIAFLVGGVFVLVILLLQAVVARRK